MYNLTGTYYILQNNDLFSIYSNFCFEFIFGYGCAIYTLKSCQTMLNGEIQWVGHSLLFIMVWNRLFFNAIHKLVWVFFYWTFGTKKIFSCVSKNLSRQACGFKKWMTTRRKFMSRTLRDSGKHDLCGFSSDCFTEELEEFLLCGAVPF